MKNIFTGIYNYFNKHRLVLVIAIALAFLLPAYFALKVKFEEDISSILPQDKKIEKFREVFQNSKLVDKLVIMVSLRDTNAIDPDALVAYAGNFESAASKELAPYIKKAAFKVDDSIALQLFNTIQDQLPLFLEEKDYKTIDSLITPTKIRETLHQNYRTLSSPAGIAFKKMIVQDPVGISFIGLKKLQQLQYDENFELYDNHIVTRDNKNLLMFITPAFPPTNTGQNKLFIDGLNKVIDSLGKTHEAKISTEYFGAAAVALGNAQQLRKDSILTQGITILFLIAFFWFYFRKRSAPFIILLPIVFGAAFALAAIYFIQEKISIIAIASGSVILGIAVNYSLHVFNHYRHKQNMQEVLSDLAFPLTIGSITTIGGFLCLRFVDSTMLKDLGLFAALSLVGAAFFSLVFLPHFISSKKQTTSNHSFSWLENLAAYKPEVNKYIILGIAVLTIVFVYTSKYTGFEADMMNMNYMSPQLKESESKLNRLNEYSLRSLYLVAEGKDLDEALQHTERMDATLNELKQRGIIKKTSGVGSILISGSLQKERIDRWNNYWTEEKKTAVINELRSAGASTGFRETAFDPFRALLNKEYKVSDIQTQTDLREGLFDDFITEVPGKAMVITMVKLPAEQNKTIYQAFENDPYITAIDRQFLTNKFVEVIHSDFSRIAWMSSILVFCILLITYGRIELALVSFIPMVITWIWILGLMGILGIKFNIINVIISALIFGLGDDYSLFIMDGLIQEYKTGKKNLSSYKSSIILSALTTITGLGVLIFAQHPALRSIAVISIIGILSVVLMSQILIPFFFSILIKKRTNDQRFPLTFTSIIKSVFAFCFFVFGCILLTVLGIIFTRLNPFNREKSKLVYHKILRNFAWSLMYIMGNVKKRIINKENEDLSTPAIIISNHQSFLDILSLIMLHPKLILFTNSWVWNSPFFGYVVRIADYFPVTESVETNIDQLADRVKNGYSIAIFPEGTRSTDGTIKRFHKGAFYLAEKLDLDILPIVIHGTGYTMSKSDFLLKDGTITLKYLSRIRPGDSSFGDTYSERAKMIGKHFREAYAVLKEEVEGPIYFREQLMYNYIYKGPVLEWYMKIKVKLEKNYQVFNDLLPKKGKILDIGCGYGFMSFMLNFVHPGREITGIDYDDEKILTAQHCFNKKDNLNFVHSDALHFSFEKYDAIILADMLHYLGQDAQKAIIQKCIDQLNDGGMIIIRDGNKDIAQKHQVTKLTEFFSTRLLKFNKVNTDGLTFFSERFIEDVAKENKIICNRIEDSKYTSNTLFVIKKAQLN